MKVIATEPIFGATIMAEDMIGDEVYGFALIPIDEEISYLVNCFDNENNSYDNKAFIYYRCVSNKTIKKLNNPVKL